MTQKKTEYKPRVALISEFPPPSAGMSVQAQQLLIRLQEIGYPIQEIRTNPELPAVFNWLERIKFLRGLIKWLIFLISCLKISKVDIVHIFSSSGINFPLFTVPVISIAILFRKKIIINYHGGAAKKFYYKYRRLYDWSIKNADDFVVPSGFLSDVFKELNVATRIIPNIANVERFSFKKRESFNAVILSARNLTEIYNIKCVIDTFKIVYESFPEAELYIAGDGPEKLKLQAQAKSFGLQDNVHFLGNVPNNEMSKLYEKCDLFINTPVIDNMPGSILEAYASGLPVISTNVGGIPYIVENKVSGLLADTGDHCKLAEHIIQVLNNTDLAKMLVENGRNRLKEWGWEKVVSKWVDEYSKVFYKK